VTHRRPTILTLADHYLPGSQAGGALRSIANLIGTLGEELEFKVLTRDRDWLSNTQYPGIAPGQWRSVGAASVMYLEPGDVRPSTLRRVINATQHDVLYLNSLFSRVFALSVLAYRRGGLLGSAPTVLAPRGQLTPGAIRIRGPKKSAFLAVARAAGLYRDIIWQASTAEEEQEIREHADRSPAARVIVAPDLPTPWQHFAGLPQAVKKANHINIVFISRIDEKKNVLGAIEMIRRMRVPTRFIAYGSAHDIPYLRRCENAMASLPAHIDARYGGTLDYGAVAPSFARGDVFLFPTFGENFGHVIVESLAAGCPVIVSDRTPFRDLERHGAGWVVPLEDTAGFHRALDACAAMDGPTHARMRDAAREYARRVITDPEPVERNRALFAAAARPQRGATRPDSTPLKTLRK
jgi:glycosyltransferase involved in cell wall biosynthesis